MEYILGVMVSVLLQGLKKWGKLGEYETILAALCLSFIVGTAHYFLGGTSFWQSMLQILTVAGATYAFILRRFPGASQ